VVEHIIRIVTISHRKFKKIGDMVMEFLDVIKNRYSVRGYESDEVEEDKLNLVLEAARLAPTAVNKQPFQFIVIRTGPGGRTETYLPGGLVCGGTYRYLCSYNPW